MKVSPLARNGAIVLLILVLCSLAIHLIASRTADEPVPRLSWESTIAAADGDPERLLLFIAERQVDGGGAWDFRRLPPAARQVWASIRFELMLPAPPEIPESTLPTYDEVAEAYAAMGLDDAAGLVKAMHQSMPSATTRAGPAWAPSVARLIALKPRIAAARVAYAREHRAEIDRRSGG